MSQTAYQAPLFFPASDAISSQEYLLVLNLDQHISTDVRYFKNKTWELAGDYMARDTEPHITVYNFLGFRQKEQSIVEALKRASEALRSAVISIDKFCCYEGSGTIYLSPRPKHYFSSLVRQLYPTIFNCSGINRQSEIYSSTEPHITIARGLKDGQFSSAWAYFRDRPYQAYFMAESLTLLRKELLKNDRYQPVEEFRLK